VTAASPPAAAVRGLDGDADIWGDVVGQERAVAELQAAARGPVHAYVLVGPRGSGKRALARAFAAALLSEGSTGEERARHIRLALAEQHPDLVVVERVGASILADQARNVRDLASRAPIEGHRKVLVLDEFHLVAPAVGPILLKTIEEPTPGTFFLVLVEDVPPELITIESRCVRIDLGSVSDAAIVERLVVEGIDRAAAVQAAAAASGDLRRARVLATDERLALRRAAWHEAPTRLDGSGYAVVRVVDELLAAIEDAAEPLRLQQAAEVEAFEARIKEYGERGSGRKAFEDQHKRALRRHRTDELRFGFAVLARRYRDALVATDRPAAYLDALAIIQAAAEAFEFNPNERLLLLALFIRLPSLPAGDG
jgi:DNA polymerase-3 subunit delta'